MIARGGRAASSLLIACYASAAVVSQLVASIALRAGTSALDVILGVSNALASGLGAGVYLCRSLDGLRAAGRVFGGWRVPGVRSQRPVELPRRQWRSAATRPWNIPKWAARRPSAEGAAFF